MGKLHKIFYAEFMIDRKSAIKKIIKECKNIGTKTAPYLYEAGIYGIEDLRKLGAEEAFFQIWSKNPEKVMLHPVYLWALEGAIFGVGWKDISDERKKEFKEYVEKLKGSF